jgi:hypothetical protein
MTGDKRQLARAYLLLLGAGLLFEGAALLFGVFYVGLAFVGMVLVNPFGLLLGPGENLFHLTVGTGSLVAAALLQGRARLAFVRPGSSGRER